MASLDDNGLFNSLPSNLAGGMVNSCNISGSLSTALNSGVPGVLGNGVATGMPGSQVPGFANTMLASGSKLSNDHAMRMPELVGQLSPSAISSAISSSDSLHPHRRTRSDSSLDASVSAHVSQQQQQQQQPAAAAAAVAYAQMLTATSPLSVCSVVPAPHSRTGGGRSLQSLPSLPMAGLPVPGRDMFHAGVGQRAAAAQWVASPQPPPLPESALAGLNRRLERVEAQQASLGAELREELRAQRQAIGGLLNFVRQQPTAAQLSYDVRKSMHDVVTNQYHFKVALDHTQEQLGALAAAEPATVKDLQRLEEVYSDVRELRRVQTEQFAALNATLAQLQQQVSARLSHHQRPPPQQLSQALGGRVTPGASPSKSKVVKRVVASVKQRKTPPAKLLATTATIGNTSSSENATSQSSSENATSQSSSGMPGRDAAAAVATSLPPSPRSVSPVTRPDGPASLPAQTEATSTPSPQDESFAPLPPPPPLPQQQFTAQHLSLPTSQPSTPIVTGKRSGRIIKRPAWNEDWASDGDQPDVPAAKRLCLTEKTFVQDQPCASYKKRAQKFERCANCQPLLRVSQAQRLMLLKEVCCCFTNFRKLRQLGEFTEVIGYLDPSEASEQVLSIYRPPKDVSFMTKDEGLFILHCLRKAFLCLAEEERSLLAEQIAPAWKCMSKCREMCDICATTIFNVHYVCEVCGFAACAQCWREKQAGGEKALTWSVCAVSVNSKKKVKEVREHKPASLMATQVLPSTVLRDAAEKLSAIDIPDVAEPSSPAPENDACRLPMQSSTLAILTQISEGNEDSHFQIFKREWSQGKPVVVIGCHKKLQQQWTPQGLAESAETRVSCAEGASQLADVVDCNGVPTTLTNALTSVQGFWQGYESMDARLGNVLIDPDNPPKHPPLYKLKDWPSKAEFSSIMPKHYDDLMACLPFQRYTHHNGVFNLSARLPSGYVKPDLGPKMYIAYGTTLLEKSTTNLHLDISDAVNVLVNVTQPSADPENALACQYRDDELKLIQRIIGRQEECVRVHCEENTPGAVWHIYAASDKEKIRSFLRKAFTGTPLVDPIHDQNFYLDDALRQRLKEEEGVEGWEIVQCQGDAVFIPAGAPHQVQNLNSCVKAAEDFVSPEHIDECLRLMNEFRFLTPLHTNREEKLQIKNIMFHSVKDAVACVTGGGGQVAEPERSASS